MLKARSITIRRHRQMVLDQACLALRPGEVLVLLGANGAGKSTFLSALANELKLDATLHMPDALTMNERPLSALSAVEQARSRTVLPQKPGLAFDLEVSEVVGMGAYPFPALSMRDVDALIQKTLGLASIASLARRRYLELSGGEQQRVQFARILLQILANRRADPGARYMLLDEPTASLDPMHQQSLLKTVVRLTRAEHIGALVILHDVNLAARWSDRVALLSDGRVLACDTPARVLTVSNIKRVYGVDVHVMSHPHHPEKPLIVFI